MLVTGVLKDRGVKTTEYRELGLNSSKDVHYSSNIGCTKPLILQRVLGEMRSEF